MRSIKSAVRTLLILGLPVVLQLGGCANDNSAPSVLGTNPANGDQHVDAALTVMSVTFNEQMMDGNWSWVYESKESFPQTTGQPRYEDNFTRNVVPVALEPGKEYVVWINSSGFKNFKDKAGNPAIPYKFTFRTTGIGG